MLVLRFLASFSCMMHVFQRFKSIKIFSGEWGCIGEFSRGGGVLVLTYISRFEISRGWHLCVFYIKLNFVNTFYLPDFLLIATALAESKIMVICMWAHQTVRGGRQLSNNGKALSRKKDEKTPVVSLKLTFYNLYLRSHELVDK